MNLRAFIKQIISENYQSSLNEIQKGDQFNLYLNHSLEILAPDVPENKFDNVNIMKEVKKQLNIKIDKIMLQTTKYPNFYVFKLGNFVIKTNNGEEKISFIKSGDLNKKYSYPYLYVYHDDLKVVRFGSRFFETDTIISKTAQEYLKNKNINLSPKAEKGTIEQESGQIVIMDDFDTDNIIDLTDWSKVKRPEAPKKNVSPEFKNEYRAGRPFNHNKYGKGIIKKTKRLGVDAEGNQLFDIVVYFEGADKSQAGKERMFRVKSKLPPSSSPSI